ncbi:MAG: response regulator, partial [Anaerovibrio sp.]|uniref:response regulator n=1 Tax=Anaerovibrio sp. TaxID=1872532 RepID=UPI001B0D46C6
HFAWLDHPLKMDELEKTVLDTIYNGGKKKILIVDDNPTFAKMATEWMKDDYQVYSVKSGSDAITFLLKTPEE